MPFYKAKVIDLTSMSLPSLNSNITLMSVFKVCSETQGNLLTVRPKTKIHISDIKRHGVHTAIPKGRNGSTAWKYWTKAHQGKGQTQVQCLGTMTSSLLLSGPTLPALLLAVYVIFLRPNLLHDHSFPSKRYLMCLASPAPWSLLQCCFTTPASYTDQSGDLCRKSHHAACCLASAAFQSLVETFMSPLVFVSCMLSTAVPYEECCQLLLPAKHVI